MNEANILKEIEKSKGYDIALFTTFNFEIPFFERFVENALLACGVRTMSLFIDAKELNKAIDDAGNTRGIGIRYVVNPIEMRGSFHPKVILLLGKGSAKLIVASANLTTSGFCVNNEIFNTFELSNSNIENKSLIVSAIDFFCRLNTLSFGADQDLFKDVIRYREAYSLFPETRNQKWLVDNIDNSIIDQVHRLIGDSIKTVDVAVPFFDNNLNALKCIQKEYTSATIRLYLQNKQSRIQIDSLCSIDNCETVDYSGFRDRDNNFFYHGKVFRFKGENTFLLYGSANCTESAISKSYSSGGNVECCIVELDTDDESKEFFDNFIPCVQGEDIEYNPLKYTSESSKMFFFRYGACIDNQICLHFGYQTLLSVNAVKYANKDLSFDLSDDELVVRILVEDMLPRNIQVTICYDDVEELIRCWYVSPVELSLHRMSNERKDPLDSIELDSEGDKYAEDRTTIIESLALSVGEYSEELYKRSQLRIDESARAGEDDEDNLPEDGIIEYTIPPADYVREMRRYEKLSRILEHDFALFCKLPSSAEESSKMTVVEQDSHAYEVQKIVQRKPTSAEKQFKQFVNRRIKGFIDPSFVEIVDYEHYIKSATVFLNVFEKYSVNEHVTGLFDDYTTASNRVQILWNLVFLIENNESKYVEETFVFALRIVLVNRFYCEFSPTEKVSIEKREQEILAELTSQIKSREDANRRAWILAGELQNLPPKVASAYIDEIYGYLPIKCINQMVTKEFAGAVVLGDRGKNPRIVVKVNTMRNKSNVSSKSIRELIKYNRQFNRWDTITLRFELLQECIDPKYPDPMVAIEYCYHLHKESVYSRMINEKCYLTRYYKSGNKSGPEPYTPPRDFDF